MQKIANEVGRAGGLKRFRMERLRDEYGAGRLSPRIAASISAQLNGEGCGHFPDPLPTEQEYEVRIYRRNTEVGRIVDAVMSPTPKGDKLLLSVSKGECEEKLQMIRDIVLEEEDE